MPGIWLWILEHDEKWEIRLTAAERPWRWSLESPRMPGCFKKTLFALASLISFVSFILIVVAMGIPKWMTGKILCKTGADLVNATDPELVKFIGEIYYGLFRGGKIRQCGLGGRRSKFTSKYNFGLIFSLTSSSKFSTLFFLFTELAECKLLLNKYAVFMVWRFECEYKISIISLTFFATAMFCNPGIKLGEKIPRARWRASF